MLLQQTEMSQTKYYIAHKESHHFRISNKLLSFWNLLSFLNTRTLYAGGKKSPKTKARTKEWQIVEHQTKLKQKTFDSFWWHHIEVSRAMIWLKIGNVHRFWHLHPIFVVWRSSLWIWFFLYSVSSSYYKQYFACMYLHQHIYLLCTKALCFSKIIPPDCDDFDIETNNSILILIFFTSIPMILFAEYVVQYLQCVLFLFVCFPFSTPNFGVDPVTNGSRFLI